MTLRTLAKTIPSTRQSDGAGVMLNRFIGTSHIKNLTPFLMFDYAKMDNSVGFPEHPHLGQETISFIMKGEIAHEDLHGNKSLLKPGDLQFMTAGRGTVHSEMPVPSEFTEGGDKINEGIQIWVDLPEHLKETNPRYRNLRRKDIIIITPTDKLEIEIISGKSHGVEVSKDLSYTPVHFYKMKLRADGEVHQEFPPDFNVFVVVIKGEILLNGNYQVPELSIGVFNRDGDSVKINAKKDSEFFLIGGKPLDQKIVQRGPFVATNMERIYQGFEEFRSKTGNFSELKTWKSLSSNGITKEIYEIIKKENSESYN